MKKNSMKGHVHYLIFNETDWLKCKVSNEILEWNVSKKLRFRTVHAKIATFSISRVCHAWLKFFVKCRHHHFPPLRWALDQGSSILDEVATC